MADTTTWTPISAPTDFQDDAVFNIDFKTKTVQVLVEQPIVAGENLSQFIKFQAPRFYDNIDLTEMSVNILYVSPAGNKGISAAVNTEYSEDMIRCGWLVPYAACPEKGTLHFVLEFVGADYTLKTTIASTPVLDSINDSDVVPEPAEQAWYIALQDNVSSTLQEAQRALGKVEGIFNALSTPMTAGTAAEMVEESAIYVYTGSETGYTYGDWYYYDGSAWVSGGVYASTALVIDPTLSQRGQAADAKVTGDIQGWVLDSTIQDYTISSGDLVRGYIDTSTGEAIISETYSYYACSEKFYYFPCSAGRVFAAFNPLANYRYSIMCYDENRNFVGYKNVNTSSVYYTIPTTTKFMRFFITDTSHAMVSLTGDWWIRVRNAFTDVKLDVSQLNNVSMLEYKNKIIVSDFIDAMSIDASQGRIAYNANYKSAKYLYPVIPNTILSTDKGQYAFANYYDKEYVFIKSARLIHNTYQSNYAVVPVPENAAFVAFSFSKAETESGDITITVINSENILYAAGDACEKYAKVYNAYVDSDGVLKTSSNFNTYIFANVNASNVYANNIIGSNGVCIDKNGNVLANNYVVPQTNYGRLFNIPEGSVVIAINEKVSYTGDDGTTLAQYASFVYSDKIEGHNLTGKKIYCIGDSITWLDNTNRPKQTGGIQYIAGYQRWLRAAGANVYSKGYDGYPIATGTAHETCIYTQVASIDKIDFSDCDYAIIEAGSNDLRYDVPVGDIATLYANANVDTATLLGAYGALTSYIRASNPKCIVIWVTPLPSNNVLKDFNKNNAYREGMLAAGAFWGCPVIDTMSLSGYNPNTNQLTYTYDGMHPNNKGMEIYGKLFANFILNRE